MVEPLCRVTAAGAQPAGQLCAEQVCRRRARRHGTETTAGGGVGHDGGRLRTVPEETVRKDTGPGQLLADCASCVGLCCVALGLTRSADFAIDKAPDEPCPNLLADHRCAVHPVLAETGFAGCVAYDCLGAGQKVVQVVFAGDASAPRHELTAAFRTVGPLHELLWYLRDARRRSETCELHGRLDAAHDEVDRLTRLDPAGVRAVDVQQRREAVRPLLAAASELVRAYVVAGLPTPGPGRRPGPGSDLAGAHLRRADLRGADLRGSLMVGADLRAVDLRGADVIGADLRGADLAGADLRDALYLTPSQVAAGRGDAATRLSAWVPRPRSWPH
jgi:hypothetical protein